VLELIDLRLSSIFLRAEPASARKESETLHNSELTFEKLYTMHQKRLKKLKHAKWAIEWILFNKGEPLTDI
jgi:hypothetical protein